MSRSKRLDGVADAATILGAILPVTAELLDRFKLWLLSLVFLVSALLPDRLFIPTRRRNKISSGPEMPPHETPLSFSGHPSQMNCTLALDESDHLRHRILQQDRYQHLHPILHQVAFLDATFILLGQLPEKPPRDDSSIPFTTSFVGASE